MKSHDSLALVSISLRKLSSECWYSLKIQVLLNLSQLPCLWVGCVTNSLIEYE